VKANAGATRVKPAAKPPAAAASTSPGKSAALALFSGLPRRYDLLSALLSFGQDPRWRKTLVRAVEAAPRDRVLDVATGTGMVAAELVRRYGCSVVALDQSEEMLERARAKIAARPSLAARIELVRGEAERLPFADREFDALTFTYLLRYVDDPAATLAELARVVKPGGRIVSLEFAVPRSRALRMLWTFYTRIGLPALGRLVSRDWYEVGRFLGPSISGFYRRYPLATVTELWRRAGIGSIETRVMSLGGGVVISGVKAHGGSAAS
jgi:demethylmenaquinone methyltransferase/2-methoxy-6-polyprenyl-1,4-benzoquinol methylase